MIEFHKSSTSYIFLIARKMTALDGMSFFFFFSFSLGMRIYLKSKVSVRHLKACCLVSYAAKSFLVPRQMNSQTLSAFVYIHAQHSIEKFTIPPIVCKR